MANPYPINVPVQTGFPTSVVPNQPGVVLPPPQAGGQSLAQKILSGIKTAQPFLEAGARTAAAGSAGRAEGRVAEADIARSQYDLEKQAYKDAIRQSLRGSLLQGLQDTKITPPAGVEMGTVTGGLRPSAIANRGEVGASIEADALKRLFEGSPEVPTLPQATGLDRGLNTAAVLAGGTSLLGGLLKQGLGTAVNAGVNKGIGAAANAVNPQVAGAGVDAATGGAGGGASSAAGAGGMSPWLQGGLAAGIGVGGNLASQYLPAGAPRTAGSYASTGASIGTAVMPGIGTAVGAGVGALIGAIKGHQNHTKGQREEFAKAIGLPSIDALYAELAKKGPAGVKLVDEGLHIIGKNDTDENGAWMERAAAALGVH